MIQNEQELLTLLHRLQHQFQVDSGFFKNHRLPEYETVESLNLDRRDEALFLTLSVIPFHAHPSGQEKQQLGHGGLWDVCKNIYQQHTWVYNLETLVEQRGEAELETLFNRLEIMDDYDADWWFSSATTLLEEFDGDPRNILSGQSFIAPHIARNLRTYSLPGLADDVSTPFWLRLMHDRIHELAGRRWIPMAVDTTLLTVTASLGDLDIDISSRDDRETIRVYWKVLCEKHDLQPMDIERPLRVIGLYWNQGGREYVESQLENIR